MQDAKSLAGKTLFVTGASRGIGQAIAVRAARDGANVAIAAKTAEPHPKLPGTIFTAAAEVEAAGGRALPLAVDIRDEHAVRAAVAQTVERFGGIDILVNNASAISLTDTLATPMKRFDLLFAVNVRGTFLCAQAALPHLRRAANPHILTLAPPLNLQPRWFAGRLAYTISKYGMSMCMLGLSEEFRGDGVAANALWPRSVIATAALAVAGGPGMRPEDCQVCRTPELVADAAHAILTRPSRECTGNFFLAEDVLADEGVADLAGYASTPGASQFATDLFVDD